MMRTRRVGAGVVAAVGVGLLTMATVAPAARAQAQAKLQHKHKLPEGQTLTYRATSKVNKVLMKDRIAFPFQMEQAIVESFAIGKRAADASLPVRVKVEGLRTHLKLAGDLEMSYDSRQNAVRFNDPRLASHGDLCKLIAMKNYTVVLDGRNEVKAIEGSEALIEKAGKLALNPEVRASIRDMFSADTLKAQFENAGLDLSDVLTRPGDTCERTETTPDELTFRKKYEYVGTEKKGDRTLDRISVKAVEVRIKVDPNSQEPTMPTGAKLKVQSPVGMMLFDRETGFLVESREKVHVRGPVRYSDMGQEVNGGMDVTIEWTDELLPAAQRSPAPGRPGRAGSRRSAGHASKRL
jgi:hypothetical protein